MKLLERFLNLEAKGGNNAMILEEFGVFRRIHQMQINLQRTGVIYDSAVI